MSFVSIVQRFAMNMRRAVLQYMGSAVRFMVNRQVDCYYADCFSARVQ